MIERWSGHGRWFTIRFREAALPLSDEQFDREFDVGRRTFRKAAVHQVNVMGSETDRLCETPQPERLSENASIRDVLATLTTAHDACEDAARAISAIP